jgi:hypothetical protein
VCVGVNANMMSCGLVGIDAILVDARCLFEGTAYGNVVPTADVESQGV